MIRLPLSALILTLLGYGVACAQTIQSAIKSSNNADQFRAQINSYVQAQIAKLKVHGSEKSARDALISQADGTPSSSFLDVYSTVLNAALQPLAAEKDIRVRLNGAVVNAELARRVNNARQASATLAFMKDAAAPVALWGLKAAKYEIPRQLAAQPALRKPDLVPEVLRVIKSHANAADINSGPLAEEAYWALTLETTENLRNVGPDAIKAVLPELFALLEYRIGLYAGGAPPPTPTAENSASLFLTRAKVWPVETAAEHMRTMKDLHDLLTAIEPLWGPGQSDLIDQTRRTGKAFQVIADFVMSQTMMKAAENVASVTEATSGDDFKTRVTALQDTIDALNSSSTAGSDSGGAGASSPHAGVPVSRR
jgi:hypothetical protein